MKRIRNYMLLTLFITILVVLGVVIGISISGDRVEGIAYGPLMAVPLASLLLFKLNKLNWKNTILGMLVYSMFMTVFLLCRFLILKDLIPLTKDWNYLLVYLLFIILAWEISFWLMKNVFRRAK